MAPITLEKMNKDIQEIKVELHRISHILHEDFELSENVKKELKQARKESPTAKQLMNRKMAQEITKEELDVLNKDYELFYGEKLFR